MAIAIGTWKAGGRYGSIFMAIFNAPVLFLHWIGHPDGLTLLGFLTGFIPFILIKPQIAIWSIFSNRKMVYWTGIVLLLSQLIWPFWFMKLTKATVQSVPAFGWPVTGWPIAVLGILLLLGAGSSPWRLMSAGTLITPYLLPYHLSILSPAIGEAKGYRKFIIWIASWMVVLGTGLGRPFVYLNFAFPLAIYFCNHSPVGYQAALKNLFRKVISLWRWFFRPGTGASKQPAGINSRQIESLSLTVRDKMNEVYKFLMVPLDREDNSSII